MITIKRTGLEIKPQTIYLVRFSFDGISQLKCTSTNNYRKDAEKFASQFKKSKDVNVVMEVISEHGNEFKDKL